MFFIERTTTVDDVIEHILLKLNTDFLGGRLDLRDFCFEKREDENYNVSMEILVRDKMFKYDLVERVEDDISIVTIRPNGINAYQIGGWKKYLNKIKPKEERLTDILVFLLDGGTLVLHKDCLYDYNDICYLEEYNLIKSTTRDRHYFITEEGERAAKLTFKKWKEMKDNLVRQHSSSVTNYNIKQAAAVGPNSIANVTQLNQTINEVSFDDLILNLASLGVSNEELTELKAIVKEETNKQSLSKKILSWFGKLASKAAEESIKLKMPAIIDNLHHLFL